MNLASLAKELYERHAARFAIGPQRTTTNALDASGPAPWSSLPRHARAGWEDYARQVDALLRGVHDGERVALEKEAVRRFLEKKGANLEVSPEEGARAFTPRGYILAKAFDAGLRDLGAFNRAWTDFQDWMKRRIQDKKIALGPIDYRFVEGLWEEFRKETKKG